MCIPLEFLLHITSLSLRTLPPFSQRDRYVQFIYSAPYSDAAGITNHAASDRAFGNTQAAGMSNSQSRCMTKPLATSGGRSQAYMIIEQQVLSEISQRHEMLAIVIMRFYSWGGIMFHTSCTLSVFMSILIWLSDQDDLRGGDSLSLIVFGIR